MFHLYTPWKHQKTGGKKLENLVENVLKAFNGFGR